MKKLFLIVIFSVLCLLCSSQIIEISNGATVSNTLNERDNACYHYLIQGEAELTMREITIILAAESGSQAIAAKANSLPNEHNYDYMDASPEPNHSINIYRPRSPSWYICVHAFRQSSYVLRISDYLVSPQEILNNTATSGNLGKNLMSFYQINVNYSDPSISSFPGIKLLATLSGISGDNVVLYADQAGLPTKSFHSYESSGQSRKIEIHSPYEDIWYFGVLVHDTSDYTLTVSILPIIPSTLSNEQDFTSLIMSTQWMYFRFVVVASTPLYHLEIDLVRTSQSGDVDLFVRRGAIPSFAISDYRDLSTTERTRMIIDLPQPGDWYIGVYGFSLATFSLKITQQSDEVNRMEANSIYTITEQNAGSWNYYLYKIENSNSEYLAIEINVTIGDPDLYIRFNAPPTRANYDLQEVSTSKNFVLRYFQPQKGDWYVGIFCFGNIKCSYIVEAYTTSVQATAITAGQRVSGTVRQDSWLFYSIDIGAPVFQFSLILEQIVGDPDLYVAYNRFPQKTQADYFELSSANTAELNIPNANATWYMGIYGYSNSEFGLTVRIIRAEPAVAILNSLYSGSISKGEIFCVSVDINRDVSLSAIVTRISTGKELKVQISKEFCSNGYSYDAQSNADPRGEILIDRPSYEKYYVSLSTINDNVQYELTVNTPAIQIIPIVNNMLSGSVTYKHWKFYSFNVVANGANNVTIILQQLQGDPDIYVNPGKLPSYTELYDYDVSVSEYSVIQILYPQVGIWYIGIYGATDCTFTITILESDINSNIEYIRSGQIVSDRLLAHNWRYFECYAASSNEDLKIQMTAIQGDPDVYVSYALVPDNRRADYKNITTEYVSEINIKNPTIGSWYIGIYGFGECYFSIKCTVDDQRQIKNLVNGKMEAIIVKKNIWQDFMIDVNYGTLFTLSVITTSPNLPNMYIRRKELANVRDYDYTLDSKTNSNRLLIESVNYDKYYISIKSNLQDTINIAFYFFFGGICNAQSNPDCKCDPQSSSCNTQIIKTTQNSINKGLLQYSCSVLLKFDYISNNALRFDFDYNKLNGQPSTDRMDFAINYLEQPSKKPDYFLSATDEEASLTLYDPKFGSWWISVNTHGATNLLEYTALIDSFDYGNCPNACSGHGECQKSSLNHYCICENGFSGSDCSIYAAGLKTGAIVTGHAISGGANYWKIDPIAQGKSNLLIQANLTSPLLAGNLVLYSHIGDSPSLSTWDQMNTSSSRIHEFIIKPNKNNVPTWIVIHAPSSSIDYVMEISSASGTSKTAMVIGIIFGLFAVAAVVAVSIIFYKRRASTATELTYNRLSQDDSTSIVDTESPFNDSNEIKSTDSNVNDATSKANDSNTNNVSLVNFNDEFFK
eukprot:TRINITY_DN239_c4_g1_i2.p1 TRINITY_DN239_c4_g1~~TRINITY_DN239_c4_g1_i2.p1  ORF type:complete len:1355 (+),score=536.88 TRINITY_DN239_c4_g1_i2:177-4241(+)